MSKRNDGNKKDSLEKLFDQHSHHHHHKPSPPKGTRGDDVLVGGDRNDRLEGLKGNDELHGNGGDDRLSGGKGNDSLFGGDGNDRLDGGKNNDILDGGAGSDRVSGSSGDDRLVYTWQEHLGPGPLFADLGTKDDYDGGKGTDTLELRLTYGEAALPAVQADLAAFEAFIAQGGKHGHHHHHHGREFEFSSFGLEVEDVEKLVVTLINNAPTAAADVGAIDEDTVLAVAGPGLLANDSDPDHLDVVKVKFPWLPSTSAMGAAVTVAEDGGYSYDPTEAPDIQALKQGEAASDTFSYTIVDLGAAEASALVTIALTGVNDKPVAFDDAGETSEDDVLLGAGLVDNDFDIDHDAVLSAVPAVLETAAGAKVAISGDGTYSYDPNGQFENLNVGHTALDGFSYTVADEFGATDEGAVSITVHGRNDAPVARDDAAATDEDTPATVAVLANDTDVDDGAVLTVIAGKTSGMGASIKGVGDEVLYDPSAAPQIQALAEGEAATDTFGYVVSDEHGEQDEGEVTVTLTGVNDRPEAAPDVYEASEDFELFAGAGEGLLANDFDIDNGDAIAVIGFDALSARGAAVAVDAEGSFFYDPRTSLELQMLPQGTTGEDSFGYTIADLLGLESFATVTFAVAGLNDAPVAVDDLALIPGDEDAPVVVAAAQALAANDTDIDLGDDATFLALADTSLKGATLDVDLDGNITYDASTSELLQTLGEGAIGEDFFDYVTIDGFGAADTGTVKVSVTGRNDAPFALDDAEQTLSDQAVTGNVLTGLSGGRDFDIDAGDVLTVAAGEFFTAAGAKLTFAANGAFTYDPTTSATLGNLAEGVSEVDAFTYTASDGKGGTASALLEVTVTGAPDEPPPPPPPPVPGQIKVSPSVGPEVDLNYYISIADVDGAHGAKWLELESFSLGFANAGSTHVGGGGSTGKASATDVQFTIGNFGHATELSLFVANGKHVKDVVVVAGTSEGPDGIQALDSFKFTDVVFTGISTSGTPGATSHALSFDYVKVEHAHTAGADKGSSGTGTSVEFDFATVKGALGSRKALEADLQDAVKGGTGADLDYYVKFKDIGEWLEVDGFNFAAANSSTIGGIGGISTGKVSFSDVVLLLGSSSELVKLSHSLLTGKHITEAEVEVYTRGPQARLIDEYVFEDVLVSGLSSSGANANSLSFDFGKFTHEYRTQDDKGGPGDTVKVSWDLDSGKTALASAGLVADALPGGIKVSPSVGPEVDLNYYISIADVDGAHGAKWLELESFSLGFANAGSTHVGGGGSTGKASATDVQFTIGNFGHATELSLFVANGKHVKDVVVVAGTSEGPDGIQALDSFKFTDVVFTGISTSGTPGATSHALSFDYVKVEHAHTAGADKGSSGTGTSVEFDFATVKGALGSRKALEADLQDAVKGGTGADLDYYVKFKDIGEWLEVDGFNFAAANSSTIGGIGGISTGKVSFSDVVLLLGSSSELVKLSHSLLTGKHITEAEVEVYTRGPQARLIDEYVFEDVLVSGLSSSGANANSLSFDFGKFTHEYRTQDDKGGPGDTVKVSWDLDSGKTALASAGLVADALPGGIKVSPSVGPEVDLNYYISIADVDGAHGAKWLELESFSLGFANAGSTHVGGGGSTGKASATDVQFTIGNFGHATELSLFVANGKHVKDVVVVAGTSEGPDGIQALDSFKFTDVVFTGISTSGTPGATSHALSFDYVKVEHAHTAGADKGSSGTGTSVEFDFATVKGALGSRKALEADLQDAVKGGTGADLDYYVKFKDIGEWLEVDGFNFAAANSSTIGGIGGISTGKVSFSDVVLLLGSSSELVKLSHSLLTGKHIKEVEIDVYADFGSKQQIVDQYDFSDVIVAGLDSEGANANELAFSFGKFSHRHSVYDQVGMPEHVDVSWDLDLGKAV